MKVLGSNENFLGIVEPEFCTYADANYVIQSVPYEHTSSYLQGSANGPAAIINASQFVEFYDEETNTEAFRAGIATLEPINFNGKADSAAVELIEQLTIKLLNDNKFVVSFGAEHTVTLGFVKAMKTIHSNFSVLQIDAHSDLRDSYNGNKFSHASVMARVHEIEGVRLSQAGIRAQCKEEADLIKSSPKITTAYAYQIRNNPNWINELFDSLEEKVYITIDADGFDPSIMPAVGTAEPNGLFWNETMELLKKVISKKTIIGFDIVECAPIENSILSEYTLAKLAYKIITLIEFYKKK